jgi:hypothetical protein
MREQNSGEEQEAALNRRGWLRTTLGSVIGIGCGGTTTCPAKGAAEGKQGAGPEVEADLTAVRERLAQAKIGPLTTVRSAHYVAIGGAASGFMKLILEDCEQLAFDYHRQFRSHGLAVHEPDHSLIVVMFKDDRSFGRFFHLPSLLELHAASGIEHPAQPVGLYERKTNLLHVFDWRNVPIASRASHKNMETLAHEGTHQLSFNTGLLNRAADTPLCIVEGIGMYGEPRKTSGHSDLGRLNLWRLRDLAMKQRRFAWIPLRELLTQDAILREGDPDRVMLAYAQSWLLVHYLLKEPQALPRFRDYLEAIYNRRSSDHRLKDARAHLGEVDVLDAELRRYAVRLQLSLR